MFALCMGFYSTTQTSHLKKLNLSLWWFYPPKCVLITRLYPGCYHIMGEHGGIQPQLVTQPRWLHKHGSYLSRSPSPPSKISLSLCFCLYFSFVILFFPMFSVLATSLSVLPPCALPLSHLFMHL